MSPEEVRLEALKLAHRHDRDPAQVVQVAKVYEDFVLGTPHAESPPPRRGRKAGNPFD
jgi:hypothetical protein